MKAIIDNCKVIDSDVSTSKIKTCFDVVVFYKKSLLCYFSWSVTSWRPKNNVHVKKDQKNIQSMPIKLETMVPQPFISDWICSNYPLQCQKATAFIRLAINLLKAWAVPGGISALFTN